jgi:hypothetical protein
MSKAFLSKAVASGHARAEVTRDSEKAQRLRAERDAADSARKALLRATVRRAGGVCVRARVSRDPVRA